MAPTPLRVCRADAPVDMRQRGHITLPRWILADPELTTADKAVLMAIISDCRGEDRSCRTANRLIAQAAAVSPATVKRSIAHLVKLGYIARLEEEDRPGSSRLTRLKFDPRGLEDTRPPRVKSDPTPGHKVPDPGSNLTRPRVIFEPPSYSLSQASLPFSDSENPKVAAPMKAPERPEEPKPDTGPYRGPRNPGTTPAGWHWSYSQGNPGPGVRPVLERNPRHEDVTPEEHRKIVGLVSQPDWFRQAPGAKVRPRVPLESPPRPAGVHHQEHAHPVRKHTVDACLRQESRESGSDGLLSRVSDHCPPQDSNLKPAD